MPRALLALISALVLFTTPSAVRRPFFVPISRGAFALAVVSGVGLTVTVLLMPLVFFALTVSSFFHYGAMRTGERAPGRFFDEATTGLTVFSCLMLTLVAVVAILTR